MDDLAARLQSELHARPYPVLVGAVAVQHIALCYDETQRAGMLAHGRQLEAAGWSAVASSDSLIAWQRDGLELRLELHNEFAAWTVIAPRPAEARWFSIPAVAGCPAGWIAGLPGEVVLRVQLDLIPTADRRPLLREDLVPVFGDHQFPAAAVSDGMAAVWTDYRLDAEGWQRVLVQDFGLSPRRRGRLVQRLLDIDTYRQMALLSLPVARELWAELRQSEEALAAAIARLGGNDNERELLHSFTELAMGIERLRVRGARRFSAAAAYGEIVDERLAELRCAKISGFQEIGEFLRRRLAPALRSCASVASRMDDLSLRIDRATELLRTRVDVALKQQNRDLLASVDRRAALSLRLQQTVEGLSVVVLTYYAVGLIKYAASGGKAAGLAIDSELVTLIAIPLVLALVWWLTRRLRARLGH